MFLLLLFLPTTALAQSLCYSPSDCVAPMVCTAGLLGPNTGGICVLPEIIEQREDIDEPPIEQIKKGDQKKKGATNPNIKNASLLPARISLMEKKKAIRESIEQAAAPSYNDIKQINIIEPTHNVADINPAKSKITDDPTEDVSIWKKTGNFFVSTVDIIIVKPAKTIWSSMGKMSLKVIGE